ncbi:hypothetical protein [Paucilactobacillus kaifaensis]|nr:hypothetical protein [Paucilactobacillus kaifaensis]
MSEIKDNSIKFGGELANIQSKTRKDSKVTVLRIEVPSQALS